MSMAWFIAGCAAFVVGIVGSLDAFYTWNAWSNWLLDEDKFAALFRGVGFLFLALVGALLMAVHGGYL